MKRPGYLAEFLEFWTPRPEVKKVWFSLFTPQVADQMPEILSSDERAQAIADMVQLRKQYRKFGYARGGDSAVRFTTAQPPRLRFCPYHTDLVGRSANKDNSVPIWRES